MPGDVRIIVYLNDLGLFLPSLGSLFVDMEEALTHLPHSAKSMYSSAGSQHILFILMACLQGLFPLMRYQVYPKSHVSCLTAN